MGILPRLHIPPPPARGEVRDDALPGPTTSRVIECRAMRARHVACPCSVHVPTLNGTLGHHVCEGTSVGSADPVIVLAVWQRQV